MTSTNFEVIARNIILPWNNYYGFITCSVVERKSIINRGHEFGEILGHECNIEVMVFVYYFGNIVLHEFKLVLLLTVSPEKFISIKLFHN